MFLLNNIVFTGHYRMLWLPLLSFNFYRTVFQCSNSTRSILIFVFQIIINFIALWVIVCLGLPTHLWFSLITITSCISLFPFWFSFLPRVPLLKVYQLLMPRFCFSEMSWFYLLSGLTVIFIQNCVALFHSLLASILTLEKFASVYLLFLWCI